MDKEKIRQLLPEEPPADLLKWTLGHCEGELGPQYLSWKKRRVPVYDLDYLMEGIKPKRHMWVAECTCLRCGGHFFTECVGSELQMWVDDCGNWWPLDPTMPSPFEDEDDLENGYMVEVEDGNTLQCPMCCDILHTIEARKLKGGRTKQILVASIMTVEQYAAVVYWLVARTIYEDGNTYNVIPRDAYVLDERGTIHRYTHKDGGGSYRYETITDQWRLATNKRDSLDMTYHDWGSILNKKKGALFYEHVPDLEGTTAEKTGLQSFAEYDGTCSVEYLKLWKKYPNLENLVNTGWNRIVNHIVSRSCDGYDALKQMYGVIDIGCTKPHEMLGMTKKDFKTIRSAEKQWNFDCQQLWMTFRKSGFTDAIQFMFWRDMFTDTGMRVLAQLRNEYGEDDPEKIIRYLKKQKMRPAEVQILRDTRDAARYLAEGRPLTQEELWPRNLQGTHDRMTRAKMLKVDAEKQKQYQAGFDAVVEKYRDLQWTDGELCIVLPKSYEELYREGETLRHCVGGYSQSHISGSDTIFFVRRYRRPERSYYTLDINMIDKPYRRQLHGYGNERHGIQKQYSHKIPQKVLDFCTRWEREILMPWWRDNQNKKEKTA